MIDWLLANYTMLAVRGRWIVLACVAVLAGIASLPHNAVDRVIGIIGVALVALAFTGWLAITIASLVFPGQLRELRRKRAEAAARDKQ